MARKLSNLSKIPVLGMILSTPDLANAPHDAQYLREQEPNNAKRDKRQRENYDCPLHPAHSLISDTEAPQQIAIKRGHSAAGSGLRIRKPTSL